MHPQEAKVIDVQDRRELFADTYLIDRLDRTQHVLHHPVPQNNVFSFDLPHEGRFCGYVTVFQDGDVCRLYYRGCPEDYDKFACTCYAESRDGIHWEKPNLGFCDFEGSNDNNILFIGEPSHAFAPFLDRNPSASLEQRYKAIGLHGTDIGPGAGRMTLHGYASADGLNWVKMQDKPIITKGGFDSLNIAFWSETENCYVSYYRVYSKSPDFKKFVGRRSIARATSDDFIHWSDPVMMDFGDTRTDELYTNATIPYFRAPHLYVALPKRYVLGRNTPLGKEQIEKYAIDPDYLFISEGCFMTSRGGNRYDRTFMEAFFRPGPDPQNWVSRNGMASWGMLQTGPTELSIYYTQHYAQPSEFLLRASLRLDGFASVHAGYGGGELLTKPFTFSGSQLELNMATSGVGSIRVEVQDADGKPFRDFGADDSYDLYGDEIARVVKWQGSTDVSKLAGVPIRLRFVMKDADLYALKFS